ncbi:hypothetical protein [Yinghuangia seranimata]|uniref:hypothetical protein n=1 Tax=Yinghuangia seranimata TaxID=408067 RepID=UPI00248C06EB|nr:hypothetical protein [Yinghuangia seranimata]MDI2126973.1 hypothetical protein [Yinghuangia seranimata]
MTTDPFRARPFPSQPNRDFGTRPFDLARDSVLAYPLREVRPPQSLDAAELLSAVGELALRRLPDARDVTLVFWREDRLLAEVATDEQLSELVGAHDVARPGPVAEVLCRGGAVRLPDLERESRWPDAARALRGKGVRSCAVAALRRPRFSLAVVVYSMAPDLVEAETDLSALLSDWVSAVVRSRVRGVV